MAAATDDVAAALMPDFVDLDFNIDDFDFDFDLAADEFCDAYSAFVANADAKQRDGGGAAKAGGWLAGLCGCDGDASSREGSPESGVTDGPLAGDEATSAFVAELERFLMEDGDDAEVSCCPNGDGDHRVEGIISADDFFRDLLANDEFNDIVAAVTGALQDGEVDNGDDVLAAREEDEQPTSRKRARHKIKARPCPHGGEGLR